MKPSIQSRFGYLKLLTVAVACMALQRADATLLFEDGFNYGTGGLGGTDVSPAGLSGNAWGGGNSHIAVVTGDLTYSGLQDLGGNSLQDTWDLGAGTVFNTYANQASGTIYYSFLLDAIAVPSASQYLTSLNPGNNTPNGSTDALQVDVGPGAGGGYEVGLRTAGASITLDPMVLATNVTYLVVVEYNFAGSGTATLYLDPVAGGSQPGASVTLAGNGSVTAIDDVGFKAQSTTAGTFLIDNLLIGTTWADVTPAASPVPEPQTYALVLAGISLLGVTHVRRMRRACAK